MKRRTLNNFFSFGYNVAVLRHASEGDLAKTIVIAADQWRKSLVDEGFRVSTKAFDKTLSDVVTDDIRPLGSGAISKKDASTVVQQVKTLLVTVLAEMEDIYTFSVVEKRYPFVKLFDDISQLFGKGVLLKLPEIAQFDFAEAGKCIVFERPTAAAFHVLRACEAVLRSYHDKLIGVPAAANATWGNLEAAVAQHSPPVDSAITGQLVLLRKRYRNQTQHPRLRYDIEEAQDLFNLGVEFVNRISAEI